MFQVFFTDKKTANMPVTLSLRSRSPMKTSLIKSISKNDRCSLKKVNNPKNPSIKNYDLCLFEGDTETLML